MARRRMARLNEQMKREITSILRSEVRDPRIHAPTITDVEVTPDLSHARVYFRLLGEEAEADETLEGLRAAAPFIRGELGRRLHVRRTPELHFEVDRALDHALRIERLLQEALGESEGRKEEGGREGDGA